MSYEIDLHWVICNLVKLNTGQFMSLSIMAHSRMRLKRIFFYLNELIDWLIDLFVVVFFTKCFLFIYFFYMFLNHWRLDAYAIHKRHRMYMNCFDVCSCRVSNTQCCGIFVDVFPCRFTLLFFVVFLFKSKIFIYCRLVVHW